MKRKFTKYPNNYVRAYIKLSDNDLYEEDKYYDILWDKVNSLSEYHPDLEPIESDTCFDLAEKLVYWATEYNDNYFGSELEGDPDFRNYVLNVYEYVEGRPYEK